MRSDILDKNDASSILRILLVEDNDHDMLAFCNKLKETQVCCTITHCTKVEDALVRLHASESAFDLVVSNFELPDKSGLDMFKEMRNSGTSLPFMIMTDEGSEHLALDALKVGIDDYIIKDTTKNYLEIIPTKLYDVVQQHNKRVNRKVEENKLRISDEYFRTILDSTPDCVLVLDKNYNTIYANKTMNEYIKRMNGGETDIQDLMQFLKERVAQVINTGESTHVEDAGYIKNKMVYSESVLSPVKDADGLTFAVSIVYRDITTHKREEKELLRYKEHLADLVEYRVSELKIANQKQREDLSNSKLAMIDIKESDSVLKATLESITEHVLVMDKDQNIINYNKKFFKLCKIPESVMKSQDANRILKFFLEQLIDPEGFQVIVDELSVQPTAESFDIIETKENRLLESYSHPLWIENQIAGRVWSFRDITEHKRSLELLKINKEQYRSIFNSVIDAFFITDFNGDIVEANYRASKMFGYSYEELSDLPIKKLIHMDCHDIIDQFRTDSPDYGQFEGELIGIRKDGLQFNVKFKTNIFDYIGKKHILAVFTDNTECKQ